MAGYRIHSSSTDVPSVPTICGVWGDYVPGLMLFSGQEFEEKRTATVFEEEGGKDSLHAGSRLPNPGKSIGS